MQKLIDFLVKKEQGFLSDKQTVHVFIGKEYPPLFFSTFFAWQEQQGNASESIHPLSYVRHEQAQLIGTLTQTFLGQQRCYWLGDCSSAKPDKKEKAFFTFLKKYIGPHAVILSCNEETFARYELSLAKKIVLPDRVDKKLCKKLIGAFDSNLKHKAQHLLEPIFEKQQDISLEQVCLFLHHAQLVSASMIEQFSQYASRFVDDEGSLLALASYFFAKQPQKFFNLWRMMVNRYSVPFWTIYWSQQLWQAVQVINFSSQGKFAFAKKAGYRLPFSFVSKRWKSYSIEELSVAHQAVHNIEYAFKRGVTYPVLDMFFSKFFAGDFSQR